MVKFTVTISPAPTGIAVNCREDGDPVGPVEAYWRVKIGRALQAAVLDGAEFLKREGIYFDTITKTGEEARIAGELRNGEPGAPGKN
jgi:hypothetical protein